MPLAPHQFWQSIEPAGTHLAAARDGWVDGYPATLPDGRQLLLPIRVLPGDGTTAVASLIINQASFAVEDALAAAMAELLLPSRTRGDYRRPDARPAAGQQCRPPARPRPHGGSRDLAQVLVSRRALGADVLDHQPERSRRPSTSTRARCRCLEGRRVGRGRRRHQFRDVDGGSAGIAGKAASNRWPSRPRCCRAPLARRLARLARPYRRAAGLAATAAECGRIAGARTPSG